MNYKHAAILALFLPLFFVPRSAASTPVEIEENSPKRQLPNILLILVDDLGYSDLEPYGSEIPTPHITQLANEGILFTNARSAMKCNPTRAMLMTGLDNNVAATGPRTSYHLRHDVRTLPEYLGDFGYHTVMAGKWDLGKAPGQTPDARGFKYSVALLPGVSTHYPNPFGLDNNPDGSTQGYLKNGRPLRLPDDFYSTEFYVDALEEGLATRTPGQPFFAYLALTAPHYPLQAPRAVIDSFQGWYDEGYFAVQSTRLARQRELGIVPSGLAHWPEPGKDDWSRLSRYERLREARRMQAYAAMVSLIDQAVSRVLDYLNDNNLAEDTLVIFASDNGADASLRGAGANDRYDNSTSNIGARDSYVTLGKHWAQVSSTPWRLVKSHPTEGGTRVPFIVRFPGRIPAGGRSNELFLLRDLLPTLLASMGRQFEPPLKSIPSEFVGRPALEALYGGLSAYGDEDTLIHTYVEPGRLGGASVQLGDWKLAWWKHNGQYLKPMLFHITEDPAETRDVSDQHADIVQRLVEKWRAYQQHVGDPISEAIPPN